AGIRHIPRSSNCCGHRRRVRPIAPLSKRFVAAQNENENNSEKKMSSFSTHRPPHLAPVYLNRDLVIERPSGGRCECYGWQSKRSRVSDSCRVSCARRRHPHEGRGDGKGTQSSSAVREAGRPIVGFLRGLVEVEFW